MGSQCLTGLSSRQAHRSVAAFANLDGRESPGRRPRPSLVIFISEESFVIEETMGKAKNLLDQLRARIARGGLSEADFMVSIAEVIAAMPPDFGAAYAA